jgi:hypothetical protein
MYEDSGAAEAIDSVKDKAKGVQTLADDITKRIAARPSRTAAASNSPASAKSKAMRKIARM